jgi:hypothetical protein
MPANLEPVIGCDGVVLLQGYQQVVSVALFAILDAKVVDDEDEHDGAPFVVP